MKTTMRVFVCFLFISSIVSEAAYAQKSVFIVSAYSSLPLGDYGDDDLYRNEKANGASIGGGVGFKYVYSIKEDGLGLFATAGLYVNGFKESAKKKFQSKLDPSGSIKATLYPVYFNVPLVMGIDYQFEANESLNIFIDGGLAINTLIISDWILRSSSEKATIKFDPSVQLGGVFECGVVIRKRVNLGIQYAYLGKHKVNTTVASGFSSIIVDDIPFMIKLFNIGLGYRFGKI